MIKYTGTIPQKMCYSTILIETEFGGSGTGFFFRYIHDDKNYNFLVSNKHVIDSKNFKGARAIINFRVKEYDEPVHDYAHLMFIDMENWERMWFLHSDEDIDIAVCCIDTAISYIEDKKDVSADNFFYTPIDKNIMLSKKDLDKLDLIEPVKFVGYPGGSHDKKNYMPIVRQGITATPLQLNYNHEEKFLIDASTFPGSSGSPVFLHRENTTPQLFYFIGVISDGLPPLENTIIDTYGVFPLKSKERLDIGIVIKAEMVVETIKQYFKFQNTISQIDDIKKD